MIKKMPFVFCDAAFANRTIREIIIALVYKSFHGLQLMLFVAAVPSYHLRAQYPGTGNSGSMTKR